MDLIQSFLYTTSRVRLSLYEQRLMLCIVEHAQERVKGCLIKDNLVKMDHSFDNVFFSVPAIKVLPKGNQHYEYVREAVLALMERKVQFWDSSSKTWIATPILYNAKYSKGSGCVTFYVSRTVFDVILDFTKGYRKYELEVALSLDSPYAARMYALMNGQPRPLRLDIAVLKKMFGVEDKYAQTADFIKKVIEPSKKALDAIGANSFTYSRIKSGIKVVALLFFPVKRVDESKKAQLAKTAVSYIMPKEIKILLMRLAGFSLKELAAHKQMLEDYAKLPSCYEVLQEIINRANDRGKEKGYIIAAMRSEIADFKAREIHDD